MTLLGNVSRSLPVVDTIRIASIDVNDSNDCNILSSIVVVIKITTLSSSVCCWSYCYNFGSNFLRFLSVSLLFDSDSSCSPHAGSDAGGFLGFSFSYSSSSSDYWYGSFSIEVWYDILEELGYLIICIGDIFCYLQCGGEDLNF